MKRNVFLCTILAASVAYGHTKPAPMKPERTYSEKYAPSIIPDCTHKKQGENFVPPVGSFEDLFQPDERYNLHTNTTSDWEGISVEQKFYVSKNKWKTPYWTYRLFSTNNKVWSVYYATAAGCSGWFINTQGKGFDRDITDQSIGPQDIPAWASGKL